MKRMVSVSQHQKNAVLSIEDSSLNFQKDIIIISLVLNVIFLCNFQ